MNLILEEFLLCFGLLCILLLSLELGFRSGRRAAKGEDGQSAGQVGAIQGAILGLLGLLLAFSFSAAAARFLERQDLIVTEANAIGTAYLRADVLDEPHRGELRAALKRYTERRIEVSASLSSGIEPSVLAEFDALQGKVWSAASAGVAAKPALAVAVLPPVNDVIDLHSMRLAAARKHLPGLVMGLLIAASALAIAVIGYGCGMSGKRKAPMTVSLVLLVAALLWITVDLDHPRTGLLQLNDAPLRAIKF